MAWGAEKIADLPAALGDDFPISFWCAPPEKFVNVEEFQKIKDAGFTLIMPPCSGTTVALNHKILDTAKEVGLRAFVMDSRMPMSISGVADAKARLDAIVADYKDHPALAGYFIVDEPNAPAFKGLGEVVAYLREKDPAHLGYINLLPTYANGEQLGVPSYEKYIEDYINTVKPSVVSYDHYHFTNHGDRPGFFENLSIVRELSLKHELPFWNIVLSISHFDYRNLTEAEKRYEAMQTLAYGGKGVFFFTYWQPEPKNWGDAIINFDGTPTRQYEEVNHVNHDVQAIGRYLLHAVSISKPEIQGDLTVSLFDGGEWRYALVANRNYKAATDAKVPLDARDLIKVLDKKQGKWTSVDGPTISVHVNAGDAELYKWRKPAPRTMWDRWRNSLEPKGLKAEPFNIASAGKARCLIALPEHPTTQEQKAADVLESWLGQITGADFRIIKGSTGQQPAIRIVTQSHLGDEGYEISVENGELVLAGGRTRGTLNAVFAFLEEDLGCRFYTRSDNRLPHESTLEVSVVSRTYVPQLRLRDPYYYVAFDPTWSLHNRTNAPDAKVPEEFGGRVDYGGLFVHTAATLLPPPKYFKDHPEYFMLDKTGKRQPWQWCPTDPDVARIVTENVLEALRKNPHAEIISVSKNDSGGDQLCQCERCKKLRESEGGAEMANQLFLVNHVAEAVETEYPNVAIDTLAYLDTIAVPKTIRPRHNVVIRLCNDTVGSWAHPFTPAQNCDIAKLIQAWSAVHDRIYIWDYHINFSHYFGPMPNIDVIASNIRFWVKNRAEGVMIEAAYNSIAEADELKSWVEAKLMWDPRLDEDELVQDFIWGYYGKAAPALAEYNELLTKAGRDHAKDLYAPPGGIRYPMDVSFLSKAFLDQASAVFVRAKELAADDSALLKRVVRAELPILYVKLCRGPAFCGPGFAAMIDQFDRVAKREGATAMEEAGLGFNERIEAWRKQIPKPATTQAATTRLAAEADTKFKVISHGPNSLSYQAFPDACRLKNGDIVCVFYAGYGHVSFASDDCPKGGRICMTRSSDEGRTWSVPQVLFDDEDDNRDPHIAQLSDGSLVCTFFSWHNKTARLKSSGDFSWKTFNSIAAPTGAQCVRSMDNGQTWEATPTSIARNWFCSAPVRTLKSGVCILGLYGPDDQTHLDRPGVIRSIDGCKTWQNPIPIVTPTGVALDAETDLIQLKDGSLYAALRSSKADMHFATSSDEGLSWTPAADIGFKGHCPHLLRLSSGEIILSHRVPNTSIHISRDECKTWQGPYEIDSCIGAYPSTVELKDGTALIVYYTEGAGSHIRAARFRVKGDGIELLPLT